MGRIFISFLLIHLLFELTSGFQCRDENNRPVDWFVLYKIPKSHGWKKSNIEKGRGYMYITSETVDDGWTLSNKSIFDNDTSAAYTLSPYYTSEKSLWLLYNDQPPMSFYSFSKGHSKGVIGGDKSEGFWLVHSVPRYPSLAPNYHYPWTGVKNGQSFLCISLSSEQLDSLGDAVIKYNNPNFYEKRISGEVSDVYPGLAKAISRGGITAPPYNKKANLTSLGSIQFQAFAKSKQFGRDIYEWVANDLNVDLMTETWQHGKDPLPSNCTSNHKIVNVGSISYEVVSFNSSSDHSKWAISFEDKQHWVCIGDINRAKTQEKRSGGTVCFQNNKLWKNFEKIINGLETCTAAKMHHEGGKVKGKWYQNLLSWSNRFLGDFLDVPND